MPGWLRTCLPVVLDCEQPGAYHSELRSGTWAQTQPLWQSLFRTGMLYCSHSVGAHRLPCSSRA